MRPEVKAAIEEAHSAGMRVVMITGDHIDTAIAIATELGIIDNRNQAITGLSWIKSRTKTLKEDRNAWGICTRTARAQGTYCGYVAQKVWLPP